MVIYEGDYLFNKKYNGKGFDVNGNVIYELKNGNGKDKKYSTVTGEIYFDHEYLNGKRSGIGKEYSYNNTEFLYEG